MTIATAAELETALNCRFSRLYSTKTPVNPTATGVGFIHSYWYATAGFPTSGLAPTATAAALNHLSTGAINFMQQQSPRTSYLASLSGGCTIAGQTVEIHDRLIQITSTMNTVLQTVTGFDLNTFSGTNNIAARKGDANYSDVQWWIENSVAGTNTAQTLNVGVTYNDGTTGTLSVAGVLNFRQARMFPLNSFIPAVDSGKFIRAINTVQQIGGTTGANPSIAFIATCYRASIYLELANEIYNRGWTELGLPEIYNQSCLFPIIIAPAATIGTVNLDGLIVYG